MMLGKNTKAFVLLLNGDTDLFVSVVMQRNILVPFLFIIGLNYVLQT